MARDYCGWRTLGLNAKGAARALSGSDYHRAPEPDFLLRYECPEWLQLKRVGAAPALSKVSGRGTQLSARKGQALDFLPMNDAARAQFSDLGVAIA